MRFLVISDIHGEVEKLDKLDGEFQKANGVLFLGDFARFKEPETGLPVFNALLKKHENIYAVLGNCDEPEFLEKLENADISVQGSLLFSDGLAFAGSGGGLTFTATTPNEKSDDELMKDLQLLCNQEDSLDNLILMTHQPAFDSGMDKITAGISTGSKNFKEFIEKKEPLVALSGHIHESFFVGKIGKTTVMNPGALAENCYGILEIVKKDGAFEVTKAELNILEG